MPAHMRRGTLYRDVIAALFRHDAEAPFNQRQVLPVLSEQDRSELVVLEREYDLCCSRFLGSGSGRDHANLLCARLLQAPVAARARARLSSARAAKRLLLPTSVTVTRLTEPISVAGAMTWTACR